MEMIVWDEKLLSVGIKLFDEDHKKLIYSLNELNSAMKIGSPHQTLEQILNQMIEYTNVHFKNEEEYMKKYDFPGFEYHHLEHEKLKREVNSFYERLNAKKASFSIELLRFLYQWLITHILGCDMSYKQFFNEKGIT